MTKRAGEMDRTTRWGAVPRWSAAAVLVVAVLAAGLVFGSGPARADDAAPMGGARRTGAAGAGAAAAPVSEAAGDMGVSPGPGYVQVNVEHIFVVKPGPIDCGYVNYLVVEYPGDGSYIRQAYENNLLIQTFALTGHMTDSLTAASGIPLEAPSGSKLAQITGAGLGCTPQTPAIVARAKADALKTQFEVWYLPSNNVPTASFTAKVSRDGTRKVAFTNTSIDVEDGTNLTYAWDFGDGKTSTEKDPIHVYAADGDYTVKLTAKDTKNGVGSKSQAIEVGPPLDGALFPFPTGDSIIKEEERVGVRLRVENDGDVPLSSVAVTSITTTPIDDDETGEITLVPKVGGETLSGLLGIGADRLDFADYDVVGKKAGKVRVDVAVEADLPDGKPTTAVITWEVEVRPAPIKVDLEVHYAEPPGGAEEPPGFQKDNNGDGKVDAADHRIEIEVTATNRGDEALSSVEVNDAVEPLDFDTKYLGGGEVFLDPIEEPWVTRFGDLAVGDSETLTFVYEAKEPVWADATSIVKGRVGDETGPLVTGVGRAEVKLDTDQALEVWMDLEERPYQAGQVVRLTGQLKNVLEDKPKPDGSIDKANALSVILDPIVEENASNGYLFPAGSGGRTPQGNTPFIVAPGETVDVGAILATARKDVASNANVRYLVRAWEIDDEAPADALALEIDRSRIVVDEEGGHGTEFSTPLAPIQLKEDKLEECETEILDAVFTCNLWVGLREFGTGLAQLGPVILQGSKEFVRAGVGITAWAFHIWALEAKALLGDPAALDAIRQEVQVQLNTWVQAKILGKEALDAAGNATVEFFQEAEKVLREGDTNQIVAWAARYLGENPDLGLAAIAKVRAARALFGTALPSAAQSEATLKIAKAAEEASDAEKLALESKIDEAIAKGENPAKNGTFKGDEDITNIPKVFRGIYGARKTEMNKMLELATKENILIAFRQRSARAADLIRDGLARVKPMDVKTKGVNEIDINYLGYRRESKDLVELVEPPIDWRLAKEGSEAEFDAALDGYMADLKNKHAEIGADPVWEAEVRQRLKDRTKEWMKEVPNFRRYKTQGIEMNFGYAEQGLPNYIDDYMTEPRKARVTTGTVKDPITGKERLYMTLEMADESGTNFLPITGDIDIVAILNGDRTPLTDAVKRTRIYQELSKLVGMQHGDSISWINGDGMIKFLREHLAGKKGAEALVVAGSDGRARMGFFEERLSTVADVDGNEVSTTTFHMVTGAPRELVTNPAGGVAAHLPSYLDNLQGYVDDPTFYLPGTLEKFMDGVGGSELAPTPFDPYAPTIQPDGEGGAEQYVPSGTGGGDRAWATAPSGTAAPAAGRDLIDAEDPVEAAAIQIAEAGFGPAPEPTVGAQGGHWVPYDAVAAADASLTGRFLRGVVTAIDGGASAGATVLPATPIDDLGMAAGSPWFKVGDQVVVDPGGLHEERHVVVKVSPFTLTGPLAYDHPHATMVVLVPRTRITPVEPTTSTTTSTTLTTPNSPSVTVAPTTPGGSGNESAAGASADPAPSSGALPRTGSSVTDMLPLAVALVLGGVGVLAIRSRSRRRFTG